MISLILYYLLISIVFNILDIILVISSIWWFINNKLNINTNNNLDRLDPEFLEWFSGFTDAEGNFSIYIKDKKYYAFRFKIQLHVDDKPVLDLIRDKLGIGTVRVETSNYASYTVYDFNHIKDIICPIFETYDLKTNKRFDFNDFNYVVKMKDKEGIGTKSDNIELVNIIKTNMNSNRKSINPDIYNKLNSILNWDRLINQSVVINKNWLIGFIEGEGSFGLHTIGVFFQIPQLNISDYTLKAIENFLLTLPNNSNINLPVIKPSYRLNNATNVISFVISDIDHLYYYIIPMLDTSKMYTRKYIDYKLWKIIVLIHKMGYIFMPEGRQLVVKISYLINSNRYSTSPNYNMNINKDINDIFDLYAPNLFSLAPPFDLSQNITHSDLTKIYSKAKQKLGGNIVYVYKNGELLDGSPFLNYSQAHRALGLNGSSRTCWRYINTGKLYKPGGGRVERYLISSIPLNDIKTDSIN